MYLHEAMLMTMYLLNCDAGTTHVCIFFVCVLACSMCVRCADALRAHSVVCISVSPVCVSGVCMGVHGGAFLYA